MCIWNKSLSINTLSPSCRARDTVTQSQRKICDIKKKKKNEKEEAKNRQKKRRREGQRCRVSCVEIKFSIIFNLPYNQFNYCCFASKIQTLALTMKLESGVMNGLRSEKSTSLWFANTPLAQNIHVVLQMNKFSRKKTTSHALG